MPSLGAEGGRRLVQIFANYRQRRSRVWGKVVWISLVSLAITFTVFFHFYDKSANIPRLESILRRKSTLLRPEQSSRADETVQNEGQFPGAILPLRMTGVSSDGPSRNESAKRTRLQFSGTFQGNRDARPVQSLAVGSLVVSQEEDGPLSFKARPLLTWEGGGLLNDTPVMDYNSARILARTYVRDSLALAVPQYLKGFKNPCWLEDTTFRGGTNGGKRLQCFPYFFLLGMPKCGSTDIYNRLVRHSGIAATEEKEAHFWNHPNRAFSSYFNTYLNKGVSHISRVCHPAQPCSILLGDGTPNLLFSRLEMPENPEERVPQIHIAQILKKFLPDAKFILSLKNPTDRTYSEYMHFNDAMTASPDEFHEQVKQRIREHRTCLERNNGNEAACAFGFKNHAWKKHVRLPLGLYAVFLRTWFEFFPRQNFHILKLEEYIRDIGSHIRNIGEFLGIETRSLDDAGSGNGEDSAFLGEALKQEPANIRPKEKLALGPMRNDTRQLLDAFYHPYNVQLAELLGDNKWIF